MQIKFCTSALKLKKRQSLGLRLYWMMYAIKHEPKGVKVKSLAISLIATGLMTNIYAAELPEVLNGEAAKINYSVGYQIGGDFRQQEIEIRPEVVLRGIQDALSDSDSLMTPQAMRKTMGELGKHVAELKKKKRQELQSQ